MLKKLCKKSAILSAVVLLLLMAAACGGEKSISKTALKLDTILTITLYGEDNGELIDAAFLEVDRLAALLDVHDENSEVYALGKNAGIKPVRLSEDTIAVLNIAKEYYELSEGYFDITAAPLINLWNISGGGYYPSEQEKEEAKALTDFSSLQIGETEAFLTQSGMMIDLGGIAKGYIADKVKEFLVNRGVKHAVLDFGGNVLLIGGKTENTGFTVGVQNPFEERGSIAAKLSASDLSIVSSGIYERYFEYNGEIYHHVLDPYTGAPSCSELAGVTVISDKSVDGDALSTACLLMGAEKAIELIEGLDNTEVLLIKRNGDWVMSSGMSAFLIN